MKGHATRKGFGLAAIPAQTIRGEVGLITSNLGWTAGIISTGVYSLMVVMVLVTTLATPAFLKLLYPWSPPNLGMTPEIILDANTTR